MAHTAHKTAERMEELEDSKSDLEAKVSVVAGLIRSCKSTVFFTGAGISTSAGIPDYRGPQGVWTLAATGKERTDRTVDMMKAIPTPTHMCIVTLMRQGLVSHIISQNVDGLHRKSGVPPDQISELHGNSNIEKCNCDRHYLRDFHVSTMSNDHSTGRTCEQPNCGGILRDNIINFGENLEVPVINKAFVTSQKSDLHICLGSSLTVKPANELPRSTKECGGKVVIVNLQRTPLDGIADVRVHARVDVFMTLLMQKLEIPILPFRLERHLVLWREDGVKLCGVEKDGMPSSIVHQIQIGSSTCKGAKLPLHIPKAPDTEDNIVKCEFFGHYDEPAVDIVFPASKQSMGVILSIDPVHEVTWTQTVDESIAPPNFKVPATHRAAKSTAQPRMPTADDFTGWHAVEPISDCPHTCEARFIPGQVFDLEAPCASCDNVGENMMCMCCGVVMCGRHVKGHMLKHHEESGHNLVCGMLDLTFW